MCSFEGPLETPPHLVECKRDSSRVEAGTSVFLSISDSDRKVPRVVTGESGLVLSARLIQMKIKLMGNLKVK